MKRLRTIVFWAHLATGLSAGLVIFIMSVTGALLAFQPQILEAIERDVRRVDPAGAERLSIAAILQAAISARPDVQPTGLTLESDPTVSALVAFGAGGNLWVNPYTGAVLGEGAVGARRIFRTITDWHRYIALSSELRPTARTITGACNLAFLGLAISGVFLWWPRKLNGTRLRSVAVFDWRARGKARDFNWHNVIGFWSSSVLVILTATATVISYPWATNLVYRISGSPPPAPAAGPASAGSRPSGLPVESQHPESRTARRDDSSNEAPEAGSREEGRHNLDLAWSHAESLMPTWGSIALRMPPRPGGPISFTMTDATHWNQFARSRLTLDAATTAVVRWEPYSASSAGQKLRGWMRFAHTGELGGIGGQFIAGVACVGGAFLVWTGFSLAVRRFLAWRSRKVVRAAARAA